MFDGSSNLQLEGKLLKVNYPNFTGMLGVEQTESLFFNDFSKIPYVHKLISSHKVIYNIFGSVIYHYPHYIFESKYQYFNNKNIALFSVNYTRVDRYFMGVNRDLWMRKVLQSTISFAELNIIPTNNKFPKKHLGTFMIISRGKGDM